MHKVIEFLESVFIEPWRIVVGGPMLTLRWWTVLFFLIVVYSVSIAAVHDLVSLVLLSD